MKNKDQLLKNHFSSPINNCFSSRYRLWPPRLRSKPCFGKTKTLASATLRKFRFTLFIAQIMARPTIDQEEKRHIRFTFRLNDREDSWLNYLTSYSNRSRTDVIRDLVFKKRILKPKIPKLDQMTYGELKRIGNNINRISILSQD